jgi:hypothetical protein
MKESNRITGKTNKAEVTFMKNRAGVNKTASRKQGSQVLRSKEKHRRNKIRKPKK